MCAPKSEWKAKLKRKFFISAKRVAIYMNGLNADDIRRRRRRRWLRFQLLFPLSATKRKIASSALVSLCLSSLPSLSTELWAHWLMLKTIEWAWFGCVCAWKWRVEIFGRSTVDHRPSSSSSSVAKCSLCLTQRTITVENKSIAALKLSLNAEDY